MNPQRSNYISTATFDDGRCAIVYPGCTDNQAQNYHALYTLDDGSCSTFDEGPSTSGAGRRLQAAANEPGCMDPASQSYNASATVHWPQSCEYPVLGCMDAAASNYLNGAQLARVPSDCTYSTDGCTVPPELAMTFNFDSAATALQGCIFVFRGCTSPDAINHSPSANVDDGTCLPTPVLGCADAFAANYDSLATVSSACLYFLPGCTDKSARTYSADVTVHLAELCTYDVGGCMLPIAANYNPSATLDDGSCALSSPPPPPTTSTSSSSSSSPPASPGVNLDILVNQSQAIEADGGQGLLDWQLAVVIASVVIVVILIIVALGVYKILKRRRGDGRRDMFDGVQDIGKDRDHATVVLPIVTTAAPDGKLPDVADVASSSASAMSSQAEESPAVAYEPLYKDIAERNAPREEAAPSEGEAQAVSMPPADGPQQSSSVPASPEDVEVVISTDPMQSGQSAAAPSADIEQAAGAAIAREEVKPSPATAAFDAQADEERQSKESPAAGGASSSSTSRVPDDRIRPQETSAEVSVPIAQVVPSPPAAPAAAQSQPTTATEAVGSAADAPPVLPPYPATSPVVDQSREVVSHEGLAVALQESPDVDTFMRV